MPLVEHNSVIRSPLLIIHIDKIEDVLRKLTRFFADRSITLKLESLDLKCLTVDQVFLFNIIEDFVNVVSSECFNFSNANTRSHSSKLNHQYSRVNAMKNFFIKRVIQYGTSNFLTDLDIKFI